MVKWQIYVGAVAAIASALSAWIAAHVTGARGLSGCGEASACDAVITSRWSRLGALPVAWIGTAVFGSLTGLAVFSLCAGNRSVLLRESLFCLFLIVVGAGLWFVFLQFAVVRRFCGYCNTVHLLGILGFVIALLSIRPAADEFYRPVAIAGICLALLIVGQLVLPRRDYAIARAVGVEDMGSGAGVEKPVKLAEGKDQESPTTAIRSTLLQPVLFLDGRVRLDTGQWPVIGRSEGTKIVAFAFDYTCDACRVVHDIVNEAVQSDPDLGVLLLPLPQNPGCNVHAQDVHPGHRDACEYARLGIGVWLSRPDKFSEFDRFLATGSEPPPLGVAMQRAQELVGGALNPHVPDERADQVIARSVGIYRFLPVKKIPSLLLPHAQVAGQIRTTAEFRVLLDRGFRNRGSEGRRRRRPKSADA